MARFRKSPRLDEADYVGPLAAHVIIVTRLRQPLLAEQELATICLRSLEQSMARHAALLHACCLMPDHVHLLGEIPEHASLERLIHHFKTTAGHRMKRLTGSPVWQTSYYDHILRRQEALQSVADYIWNNPVSAGLVQEAREYAWSGPRHRVEQA